VLTPEEAYQLLTSRRRPAGSDEEEQACELAKDLGYHALADALPNGHEKSIAHTMLRSIRGLGAEGLDFLRLASVGPVAPIPAWLVTQAFQEADKLSHEDAEERASLAFKQVTSASLAEIAGEQQNARTVHTLVSRAVRFHEKGALERSQALRAAAVKALWALAIPATAAIATAAVKALWAAIAKAAGDPSC